MRATVDAQDSVLLRAAVRCAVALRVVALHALVLGTAALLAAAPARADIWKFVDANGVTHLADRKLGPGYVLVVASPRPAGARRALAAAENRRRFTPLIRKAAWRYRLDAALVHAVIAAESSYDPGAVSHAGAVGLMQLMPDTARRYGVRDRYNPVQNVYGGTRYLRDLLRHFENLALALAAYNAGENAVARHGNRIPPYAETREYVRRVLSYYRELRESS